ncbi:MAG TPA: hypothetical protein VHU44_18495 [Acidobacteriaceae bacterium]|nr:hypothetical protein [Acidobacteriaceae bacterium]
MHRIQTHFSQQGDSFTSSNEPLRKALASFAASSSTAVPGLALRSEAVDGLLDALRVGLSLVRLRQSGAESRASSFTHVEGIVGSVTVLVSCAGVTDPARTKPVLNPGTASASATWTNTPVDLEARQNKLTPMMMVYTGGRFG